MKKIIVMVFLSILAVLTGYAQENQFTPQEQELINLSNQKWQWMSEKNADKLADLFHDTAQFLHMGGYWGKEQELKTIRDGGI